MAQSVALHAVGGRTAKSESNFFSSIGRIQAGAKGEPEFMFLGSSITGRLPDRTQGFEGTANMGCDGGSAVDVLRAMDQGILPAAPHLIIEANTLQLALDSKPTEIASAMRAKWFQVGLQIPNLAAYSRPAAFLYSQLLELKIGSFQSDSRMKDLGATSHPRIPSPNRRLILSEHQTQLISEVGAILERLRKRGSDALIIWLPPRRSDGSPPPEWILELARISNVPYWDLGQEAATGTVTLTDGVHMAPPSASRAMVSMIEELRAKQ